MTSGPEEIAVFDAVDALPAAARGLFGPGFFDTLSWYETTCRAALPAGARPAFVCVGGQAVVPMLRQGGAVCSLTTPYSCLWGPLGGAGLDAAGWRAVGAAFGRWCRGFATVRLDAMDPAAAFYAPFLAGARAAGLAVLTFDHFGNWHMALGGLDWAGYLAGRPGELREAIRRRTRKLLADGGEIRVVSGGAALEGAIAEYEAVYSRSWKDAEPYPAFNAALMRACAADGSLRLGLLARHGVPLAAQMWVVRATWAAVLKLAHDENAKALSPGTVLTAAMIRTLIEQDGVTELDFGRGDDDYKAAWTGARRQRVGVVLANPWRAAGAAAIVRRRVRDFVKGTT